MVERPLRRADDRPQRAVILAQQVEHLLRLGGLGEGGKPAQIAEHDDDVAPMRFEDVFVAARDDQFGELRREKPLQPADPLQFAELRRDPVLQLPVPRRDLVGARPQFAEQPRVLHRDDRLRREILYQRDLLVREWPHLLTVDRDSPEEHLVFTQRDRQNGAEAAELDRRPRDRVAADSSSSEYVYDLRQPLAAFDQRPSAGAVGPGIIGCRDRSGIGRWHTAERHGLNRSPS